MRDFAVLIRWKFFISKDEEGETSNNLPEINNGSSSITNNPAIASDEGEVVI